MELFATEYRTLAGCVVEGFWAGGKHFSRFSIAVSFVLKYPKTKVKKKKLNKVLKRTNVKTN